MSYKKLSQLTDPQLDRLVHEVVEGMVAQLDPDSSAIIQVRPAQIPHYTTERDACESAVRALIVRGRLNTRTTWPLVTTRCLYKGKMEPVAFLLQNNGALKPVPGARNWTIIRNGRLERAMCELLVLHFYHPEASSISGIRSVDLSASATTPVTGIPGLKLEDDGSTWSVHTAGDADH